jgi:very-short-patch-repair endonuclease
MFQSMNPPSTINRARRLRRDGTFPERLVWSRLRSRQLVGAKFRRQHPIGPWIADFACEEVQLVIELDGDTHGTPDQAAWDARRTRCLEAEGWTVLRFWNADVFESLDGTLGQIEDAVRALRARQGPHLPPPPAAGLLSAIAMQSLCFRSLSRAAGEGLAAPHFG